MQYKATKQASKKFEKLIMDKIDKMDYQTNSISSESSDVVDSSGSCEGEPLAEYEMDKILKEHDLYSDKEEETTVQKVKEAEVKQ